MTRLAETVPAALLALGLTTAPTLGVPVPAISLPADASIQLAAAEKVSDKVDRTKAWLKVKKTQTTRWMVRQKRKLKRIVD